MAEIFETKMSEKEVLAIKKHLQNNKEKLGKTIATCIILFAVALLLPSDVWNALIFFRKCQLNISELEVPMYKNIPFVITGFFMIVVFPIIGTYFGFVHHLKKDFKEQRKIGGRFKVIKVRHLSKKLAESFEGKDVVLYFEKNKSKIDRHFFKKSKTPELLEAKEIYVEYSKYSRKVFKEEIVVN